MAVSRDEALRKAGEALEQSGDSVTVDREALNTLNSIVKGPTQGTADDIWKWLVVGLLTLSGISLIGMLYLLADGNTSTSPDLALTAFTASLTGLLGLFIRTSQGG
jgi:hypothetical protein